MEKGELGPKIYHEAEGPPGGQPDREFFGREWSQPLLEKLNSSENPQTVRWRLWKILSRVVDQGDDWTARMLKSSIDSKVTELEEETDPFIASFESRKLKEGKEELLKEFRETEENTDAVLTFFLEFGRSYNGSAGSEEYLSKLAVNTEVTPEIGPTVMQTIFNLPGFKKETENWPQLGEQIGKALMAYEYIAVTADPRWGEDLEYIEGTKGFQNLFGTKENAHRWINELKLDLWAKELDLEGKRFEELSPEDRERVEEKPVLSRFAVKLRPGRIETTKKAVQKLILGVKNGKDTVAKKQAEIAEVLGFNSSLFFGQSAYYGALVEGEVGKEGGEYTYTLEGYPISDAFVAIFNPQIWVRDRSSKEYWAGPRSKIPKGIENPLAGLPERMHVPFLRFYALPDQESPDDIRKTKSLWEELWLDGKPIGKLSWDRLPEKTMMRGYLLRAFLLLRKPGDTGPAGVLSVLRGDDWRVKPGAVNDYFYWKELRRWIHIVAANQLIVNGQFQRWFSEREKVIEKSAEEIQRREKKEDGTKYTEEEAKMEAAARELKEKVGLERERWKKMIVRSMEDWYSSAKPEVGEWKKKAEESGFYHE